MKIARSFRFEACHRLPHHDGPCSRFHGHSYRMEVVMSGAVRPPHGDDPQSGFVADFGRLKEIVQGELLIPFLDHHNLNESIPNLPYPSAEYLATWILAWCLKHLEGRQELGVIRVEAVRLWESEHAWAESSREDAQALFPHGP